MHMTRKWFWVDSTCPIHALIKTQRTQKADSRVQRGCTRGVGSMTGESSGPWTASLTAMKSLTTSCVFEESMPIPNNVSWRRLAKPVLLVPVLRITSIMHSRIAVVWALFGCLPINSRVSLSAKLTTTGHGAGLLFSASLIITCASS